MTKYTHWVVLPLVLWVSIAVAQDRWPGHTTRGAAGTAPVSQGDTTFVLEDIATQAELDAVYPIGNNTVVTTPAELDTCLEAGTNQSCLISGDPFVASAITWSPPRATNSGLITGFKDASACAANTVDVDTSVAHGFSTGQEVRIANTANYDGWYQNVVVADSDTFCLSDNDVGTFPGTETGTYQVEPGVWNISCLPGTRIQWQNSGVFLTLFDVTSQNQFHDNLIQVDLSQCNIYFPSYFTKPADFYSDVFANGNSSWLIRFMGGTMVGGVNLTGFLNSTASLELQNVKLETWPIASGVVGALLQGNTTNQMQIMGGEIICQLRDDTSGQTSPTCAAPISLTAGDSTFLGMKYTNFNSLATGGNVTMVGLLMTENMYQPAGGILFGVDDSFSSTGTILDIQEGQSSTDGLGDMNTLISTGTGETAVKIDLASITGCPDVTIALDTTGGLPDRFYLNAPYPDGCTPHLARVVASVATPAAPIASFADDGGGDLRVTTSATHNIDVNDWVILKGTTDYDTSGTPEKVLEDVDATNFDIDGTFGSTRTGSVLEVDDGWQYLNANASTVADLIFPDRSIHIEGGEVYLTTGGAKAHHKFCGLGQAAGADSFFQSVQSIADRTFGGAGCDGLGPHATVGAADESISPTDYTAVGMRCTALPTIATTDVLTFTLMDDTVAVTDNNGCATSAGAPDNYCDFTCDVTLAGTTVKTCRAEIYAPKTVAGASLMAFRMESDGSDSMAATDFECVLETEI